MSSLIYLNIAALHHYPYSEFLFNFGRYNLFKALRSDNKNTKIFFSVASNPGNQGSKFYNSYFKKNINAIYLPLKLKT